MGGKTSMFLSCRPEWVKFGLQTKIPILYYHRVKENIPPKLGVSPEFFEAQMGHLRRKNYTSISFEDAVKHISFGHCLPSNPFIISFDDGYADAFTHAYPILKRFGFSATVFLVSDYIGKRSEWDGCEKDEVSPLLTKDHIYTMMADGFHFGSHGRTHKKLTSLPAEEVSTEVEKSKADLENLLQRPVRSFCYPYGDFNPKIIEVVKEAGYSAARTVHAGNLHCGEDLHRLKSIKINGLTPLKKFKYRLSRIYHWEQIWQERRKTSKERSKRYSRWRAEEIARTRSGKRSLEPAAQELIGMIF